nr:MAG TPA: hypothetical protein [Caudoviricetes sp.]
MKSSIISSLKLRLSSRVISPFSVGSSILVSALSSL